MGSTAQAPLPSSPVPRVKAALARANGRLPAELGSVLRELKDERENGDYSVFPAITAENAARAIAAAEKFVREMETFLEGQVNIGE
jgi:hypothetical protein